jgi:adenylosuccinate synthase
VPGWTEDITGVRKFDDLPKAARDYVQLIESSIGRPARFVSVGAHRTAMIVRDGALRAA